MKLDDFISLIFPEYLWFYSAERDYIFEDYFVTDVGTYFGLDTTSLIDSDQTDCTN